MANNFAPQRNLLGNIFYTLSDHQYQEMHTQPIKVIFELHEKVKITDNQANAMKALYADIATIQTVQWVMHVLLAILIAVSATVFVVYGQSWFLSSMIAIVGNLACAIPTIQMVMHITGGKKTYAIGNIVEILLLQVLTIGFVLNSFLNIHIITLQLISYIMMGLTCVVFPLLKLL
jgi:hypothetical protein